MSDKMIRRAFEVERLASDKPGVYDVMIMTGGETRGGWLPTVAVPEGGVLEHYEKNPVVLWAHNYREPPIGRALALERVPGKGIRSSFEFTPLGENPMADVIHQLWDSKFLNAVSIGFVALSAREEKREGRSVVVYDKWELLEYSIVPIGADRDALRLMVRGLDNEDTPRMVVAGVNELDELKAVDPALVLEFLQTLREVYHV